MQTEAKHFQMFKKRGGCSICKMTEQPSASGASGIYKPKRSMQTVQQLHLF